MGDYGPSGDGVLVSASKILTCERGSGKWEPDATDCLGSGALGSGQWAQCNASSRQGVTNLGSCWVMSSCGAMTTV